MSTTRRVLTSTTARLVWGGLALALGAALLLSVFLSKGSIDGAEADAEAQAVDHVNTILFDAVTPEQLEQRVAGTDYRVLLAQVQAGILVDEDVTRVRIWNQDATLVFSSDQQDQPGEAVAAEDPHLGLLDLRLHFALGPLHELDDLPRLLDGDALLQFDPLPDAPAPGGFRRTAAQRLERNLALHKLRLQDVQHLLQLELVFGGEDQRVLLAPDVGGTPLEVEALRDLSRRLVDSVVDLLQVDLGGDVEGTLVTHVAPTRAAASRRPTG